MKRGLATLCASLTVGLVGLTPAQAAAPSSLTVVVLTSGVQVQPPAGYTQSLTAVTASPAESWKLTLSSPTGCESSGPPYCTGSWLLAGQSNDTLVGNWSHFEDCWAFSVTGGGGRFAGVTASSAAQSRFPEALGYCAVSGISVSSIIPIGVLSDIPVGLLTFKFGT